MSQPAFAHEEASRDWYYSWYRNARSGSLLTSLVADKGASGHSLDVVTKID